MARSISITGDKELDLMFRRLAEKAAKNVAFAGIRAGMRVIVKGIKSEIPPHMKEAKKAIGSRFKRNTGKKDGVVQAKVGAAVGKKKSVQAAAAKKAKATHGKGKKPGVGITSRNIHWLLLGTGDRTQKTTGRRTGIMPGMSAVRLGFNKSEAAAIQKIKEVMRKGIAREAAKK